MTAVALRADPAPASSSDLLGRRQAAEFLEISYSEFRRRENLDFYQPTLVDAKGWRLYSQAYLESVRGRRSDLHGVGSRSRPRNTNERRCSRYYEPEMAAKVFEELKKGLSSHDIVMKLFIHPDAMGAIYEAWEQLAVQGGGGIRVPAITLAEINRLPLPGSFPVTNAAELLDNLREASKQTPMCPGCKTRPSRICMTCAEPGESPALLASPVKPRRKTG